MLDDVDVDVPAAAPAQVATGRDAAAVLVAERLEAVDDVLAGLHQRDADHDVDDRLALQVGDGGAADVLDRDDRVAELGAQPGRLALVGRRPGGVVLGDGDELVDGRHGADRIRRR